MLFVRRFQNGEQGLSVPDAQMLTNIAGCLGKCLSRSLLGESIEENVNVNEIAVQLAVFKSAACGKAEQGPER